MAQDSIHKIITIEIEYSKLIKGWAEAQKVIDETRQSIKNLKKEDADYYEKMARYKAVIRDNTDAQRQYMKQINEQVKKDAQLDGSVNKLRSDISKLTKEYYALSEADRKSAKGMKMAEQVRNMQTEVNKAEQDLLNFRSNVGNYACLLYTSPSPRDLSTRCNKWPGNFRRSRCPPSNFFWRFPTTCRCLPMN